MKDDLVSLDDWEADSNATNSSMLRNPGCAIIQRFTEQSWQWTAVLFAITFNCEFPHKAQYLADFVEQAHEDVLEAWFFEQSCNKKKKVVSISFLLLSYEVFGIQQSWKRETQIEIQSVSQENWIVF